MVAKPDRHVYRTNRNGAIGDYAAFRVKPLTIDEIVDAALARDADGPRERSSRVIASDGDFLLRRYVLGSDEISRDFQALGQNWFVDPRTPPLDIFVCGLDEVQDVCRARRIDAVVSLLDPGSRLNRLGAIKGLRLLEISCLDIHDRDDPHAPRMNQAREILRFADSLPAGSRLLVHCFAGVSRSTAVAHALLARQSDPEAAAERLAEIRPGANPNRLLVENFDRLCGWRGRLSDAACRLPVRNADTFEPF